MPPAIRRNLYLAALMPWPDCRADALSLVFYVLQGMVAETKVIKKCVGSNGLADSANESLPPPFYSITSSKAIDAYIGIHSQRSYHLIATSLLVISFPHVNVTVPTI
jgi:hypothetical protein